MFKNSVTAAIQAAWLGSCIAASRDFHRAAKLPLALTQSQVLGEILGISINSDFGRRNGLAKVRTPADLQNCLPIREYEDFRPEIEKIASGEANVLTSEPVKLFELTSGSDSASKFIPYTSSLQESFNRALHPWLIDLYRNNKGLWGGPAYWVITPKVSAVTETSGGIKVGFAADSEYFGSWGKALVELLMAVPAEIAKIRDIGEWKYQTLLNLLATPELRLISLWNPSFINSLFSPLIEFSSRLAQDLEIRSGRKRAKQFSRALEAFANNDKASFSKILWPRLGLISAWSEAEARVSANELQKIFAHARFQTKGILATEAAITIPITSAPYPVLAARSAFFEFMKPDSDKVFLAHELETQQVYSLIITTFGGLFRYRLRDLVKLEGFYHNFPCFSFTGKEDMVSDLCGEKLNANHIKQIFNEILPDATASFMAPARNESGFSPCYELFVSRQLSYPGLEKEFEKLLRENFHYNWCVENGQLLPLRLKICCDTESELMQLRLERLAELKTSFSTAKTNCLNRLDGWSEWFSARSGLDH